MSKCATAEEAMAFVREHGVVLMSAKGAVPRLTEAIIGEPIKGSWWAHPRSHHIFAVLTAVTDSEQVLVCRLIDGKVTLVHRRLWPSLVRLASRFAPEQLAKVPAGAHRIRSSCQSRGTVPGVGASAGSGASRPPRVRTRRLLSSGLGRHHQERRGKRVRQFKMTPKSRNLRPPAVPETRSNEVLRYLGTQSLRLRPLTSLDTRKMFENGVKKTT